MIIINFGHPVTPAQQKAIEAITSQSLDRVINVASHFDQERSFAEQARELVDAVGLTPDEWQSEPIIVSLPTLHVGSAAVLAELHGRCGFFPAVLRLRPAADSVPQQYEVAEVMNLQAIREAARIRR